MPNFSESQGLIGGTATTTELKYTTSANSWYSMMLQTNSDTGCDVVISINGIDVAKDYSTKAWHKLSCVLYLKKNTKIKFHVTNNVNITCFVSAFK